jgi:hypothetical protein
MTGATVVAKAEKAPSTKVAKKAKEVRASKPPAEVTHVEILRGSQKSVESFKSEK